MGDKHNSRVASIAAECRSAGQGQNRDAGGVGDLIDVVVILKCLMQLDGSCIMSYIAWMAGCAIA